MGLRGNRRSSGNRKIELAACLLVAAAVCGAVYAGGLKVVNYIQNRDQQGIETGDQTAETEDPGSGADSASAGTEVTEASEIPDLPYYALADAETSDFSEDPDINSRYAILIDVSDHRIVAEKNAEVRMNPASMTKVMTLLVAAENVNLDRLNENVEISQEANDYAYINECSTAGFETGDIVTLQDLFYGTILPSGGEAACQLAMYTAGTQETFVEVMNEKLEELGLADSAHFVNCVGINDENHYCTAYDMAIIMEAAMENDFCRQVLSAHSYSTSPIKIAPEGETLSNLFLRRIEDRYTDGLVIGAKTGYTAEAGSCAVSYARAADGKEYVCVTGSAEGSWKCIADHVEIYTVFTGDMEANLKAKTDPAAENTETSTVTVTTEESGLQ